MSIYPGAVYPTPINLQGTPGASYRLGNSRDGTASVVIQPGDLTKKVTPVGGNDEGLFTAADLNTLPIRIADIPNLGVVELKDWSTFGELDNYAVGDPLITHMPSARPGRKWGCNVRNDAGVPLDLVVGDRLTVSSTTAGKLAKIPAIDATTFVGAVFAEVAKNITIPATSEALVEVIWLGQ